MKTDFQETNTLPHSYVAFQPIIDKSLSTKLLAAKLIEFANKDTPDSPAALLAAFRLACDWVIEQMKVRGE